MTVKLTVPGAVKPGGTFSVEVDISNSDYHMLDRKRVCVKYKTPEGDTKEHTELFNNIDGDTWVTEFNVSNSEGEAEIIALVQFQTIWTTWDTYPDEKATTTIQQDNDAQPNAEYDDTIAAWFEKMWRYITPVIAIAVVYVLTHDWVPAIVGGVVALGVGLMIPESASFLGFTVLTNDEAMLLGIGMSTGLGIVAGVAAKYAMQAMPNVKEELTNTISRTAERKRSIEDQLIEKSPEYVESAARGAVTAGLI